MSPRPRRLVASLLAALVLLVGLAIALAMAGAPGAPLRSFYMPAESMAPTLKKNDRLIALMTGPGQLRRGDVVLLRVGDRDWVKRLAALPGDRIALSGGVVILNGAPVPQRLVVTEPYTDFRGERRVRRLAEQFPGELAPHEIYDLEPGAFDDLPEQVVATGHVFVLGDNRDRSADSRVPRDEMGLEQVPISAIVGRAWIYSFGSSRPLGTRINP